MAERTIPTIQRRGGGGGIYGVPGYNHPAMFQGQPQAAPQAPQQPAQPVPAMSALGGAGVGAGGVGNRFGSTVAFQQSLNRDRALKRLRAGTFADLKARKVGDAQAGQMAFAATQMAGANLDTDNAFLKQHEMGSATERANQESGAKVGLAESEAGMNRQKTLDAIPAAAELDRAKAGNFRADSARNTQMLPGDVESQQLRNHGTKATNEMIPAMGQAELMGKYANTQATLAGAHAVPNMSKQVADKDRRIAHLEGLLAPRMSSKTDPVDAADGVAADEKAQGLSSNPTMNPYSQMPAGGGPGASAAGGGAAGAKQSFGVTRLPDGRSITIHSDGSWSAAQ